MNLKKMSKAQLLEIVEKLPVTKDGVPVVPDVDFVFHPDFLYPDTDEPVDLQYNQYGYDWSSPVHDAGRKLDQCYSTPELAKKERERMLATGWIVREDWGGVLQKKEE